MRLSLFVTGLVLVAIACVLMLGGDTRVMITPATPGAVGQPGFDSTAMPEPRDDTANGRRQAVPLVHTVSEQAAGTRVEPAIVGRVVDAGTRPVGGAQVLYWSTAGSGRTRWVDSDVDGGFRIELPPGSWSLAAHHAAHGKSVRDALQLGSTGLQVGDLVLQTQPALLGRLVYPDGQPIADCQVRVGPVAGSGGSPASVRNAQVRTDIDGRFAVRNLEQGEYELLLRVMSFRGDPDLKLRVTTGHSERELVVDRHRIRLRNSDDLGITGWRESRAPDLQEAQRSGRGWQELWDSADLWAAGNIADSFVPRGSCWYLNNSEGDKWGEAVVHADRLRNETDLRMKLRRVEMSGTLRLRVRAPDGSMPRAVKVKRLDAAGLDSPEFYEAAPRDGDDFLFRVAPGKFVVAINIGLSKSGLHAFRPVEREIRVRADQETLLEEVARTGGRVQMTVHLPSGEKGRHLSRFRASTLDESGNSIEVKPYQTQTETGYMRGTPRSGQLFTCVRILRPGHHEFTVTAKGYEPVRVAAFLQDGKRTPIDVHLHK